MTTTARTTTPAAVDRGSQHRWVPYVAVISGAILLLKAVLIIGSEDGLNETFTALLYLSGVLLGVVAAVGAGLRARRGRRTLVAVGLSAAFLMFIISGITEPLFGALSDAAWVEDEGPIGLLGLVVLLLGARARASD